MSESGERDPHRSSLGRPTSPQDIVQRPHPLRERSQSQNNTLAIRIVPYTPPRLDAQGRSASQSSANPHAPEARSCSGNDGEQGTGPARTIWARRASDRTERPSGSQASALSSPSSSATSLARSWEGVGGVSASKPATGPTPQPAPGPRPRSDFSNSSAVNAAAAAAAATDVQSDDDQDGQTGPASPTASAEKLLSRRRNFIAVHADKTFSLVPRRPSSDAARSSLQSPPLSLSTVRSSSSHERLSSDAFSDDRPSSPGTTATFADLSLSPSTPSPTASTTQLAEDPIPASPGNDRMVGGLRKVPKTPDSRQKKAVTYSAAAQETPLAPLPEASSPEDFEHTTLAEQGDSSPPQAPEDTPPRLVIPKDSFTSEESTSTLSETTNYKVYEYSPSPGAQDSTDSIRPPSSNDSNVQLLGESSPAAPVWESSPISIRTPASDQNYVVHGDPSPAPSFGTVSREPRPTYSQESLLVPPLRTARRRSPDKYGYYKSRSRESLRRTGSIKSIRSISSIISEEANQPIFAGPALINFRGGPSTPSATGNPDQPDAWEATPPAQTAPAPAEPQRRVQMVESHPHQWSSQLSTVMSEDEEDSPRGSGSRSARSASLLSATPSANSHRRRSSAGWASSTHSRQMLSISSSLAAQLEEGESLARSSSAAATHSRSNSLDRPQPAYVRGSGNGGGGGSPRIMVRDQDEYGDGLADLNQHPSRTGLSGFFASSANSSSRNLHSSASSSSRANSFTSGANIPAWARLYYGSGEQRRLIGAPSISEESEDGGSGGPYGPAPLRRVGSFRSDGSPSADHFPLNIYSKRKRAKQAMVGAGGPFSDSSTNMVLPVGEAATAAPAGDYYYYEGGGGGGGARQPRHKTSSIWSPHLRFDRRASRYSIWEPPSVSWSAESGLMGRRNAQVVLFMAGFIFPFAWMIAAFLPLPAKSQSQQMLERAQGEFGVPEAFKQQLLTADEVRYQSARWWRNLNRCMAFVGLLILGAVVALVVIGVRQGWGLGR
ncbi:uncharacterized protein E0L32_000967 [Thyridium curvatum]|uniref:Serine-rich protein n=1 Tax=Thyridium curvatum TaxID=1093900 RepID=A0A507B1J3_9PEZI|nr:uncharacterized protein E0L32_000967 [Thyridium curvatum]TPX11149.1 hypothetical protein E0L32_000967 [Thyridium curvatum]